MYLFNNVYLTPDKTISVRPGDDYGYVSSQLTGSSFHVDNFFGQVFNITHKQPLFNATSHQDLMDRVFQNNEQKLFDLFTQHRTQRLVLMCNEEAMLKLATKTLKTMLPNATVETGWQVLKYLYAPFFYLYDSGLLSFLGPNNFQTIYTNLLTNEASVRTLWAKTKPWKLSVEQRARIQQTASVELQTATYLANPKWRQASAYKDKVVKLAQKTLVQILANDCRQKILEGFVDIHKINPAFNAMDRDIMEKVAADPTYKFLVDPNFVPDNVNYVFDNYDMGDLCAIFEKYAPLRAPYMNVFTILLAKENALTFDDIFTRELQSTTGRLIIGANLHLTASTFLLDLVFDLHKSNPQELKRYSLDRL